MDEKAIQTLREAISRHSKPSAVGNMFLKALLAEGYSRPEIMKVTHTIETLLLVDELNSFHPETPDEKLPVSDSERRNFSS